MGSFSHSSKLLCMFFFFLQSHVALHGEFLLVSHTLCWFVWGAPLTCPVLVSMGSFSYMPSAGFYREFLIHAQCWFMCGVSLTHPMLASFSSEFLSLGLCWLLYVGNFFFTKKKKRRKKKKKKRRRKKEERCK